jgi:hypothetical protein
MHRLLHQKRRDDHIADKTQASYCMHRYLNSTGRQGLGQVWEGPELGQGRLVAGAQVHRQHSVQLTMLLVCHASLPHLPTAGATVTTQDFKVMEYIL